MLLVATQGRSRIDLLHGRYEIAGWCVCADGLGDRQRAMETAQHRDRLAPAEITMFQISEVQESPAFNGRRSFLTLRGYVFNPIALDGTGHRVESGTVSRVISSIGQAAAVKVAEKRTGVKWASAHDLRRAFGFRWAYRVMPPVLQQLMRHSSISTTTKFYVGRNAEATAEACWDALANTSANTAPEATDSPV